MPGALGPRWARGTGEEPWCWPSRTRQPERWSTLGRCVRDGEGPWRTATARGRGGRDLLWALPVSWASQPLSHGLILIQSLRQLPCGPGQGREGEGGSHSLLAGDPHCGLIRPVAHVPGHSLQTCRRLMLHTVSQPALFLGVPRAPRPGAEPAPCFPEPSCTPAPLQSVRDAGKAALLKELATGAGQLLLTGTCAPCLGGAASRVPAPSAGRETEPVVSKGLQRARMEMTEFCGPKSRSVDSCKVQFV